MISIFQRGNIKQRQPEQTAVNKRLYRYDWLVFIGAIISKCGLKQKPLLQQPNEVDKGTKRTTVHLHVCNKAADNAEFQMIIWPLSAVSPIFDTNALIWLRWSLGFDA